METVLLDCIGRRRSPATMPGYQVGRRPRNRRLRCSADPPPVEEITSPRFAGPTFEADWRG